MSRPRMEDTAPSNRFDVRSILEARYLSLREINLGTYIPAEFTDLNACKSQRIPEEILARDAGSIPLTSNALTLA